MNEVQTIAGMTILAHVARTTAEYGATVEVPTTAFVILLGRTFAGVYLTSGLPDCLSGVRMGPQLVAHVLMILLLVGAGGLLARRRHRPGFRLH
jgi:hypothetical protein